MNESIVYWDIRQYNRQIIEPVSLAKSWGSDVNARQWAIQTFGCIPFPYTPTTNVKLTSQGLKKKIKRMRSPESLFAARQRRILKRLQEKEPLFYQVFKDDVLANDQYTLDHYKQMQQWKINSETQFSVSDADHKKLWINPNGEYLQSFNWLEINQKLSDLFRANPKQDIYELWDNVLYNFGVLKHKNNDSPANPLSCATENRTGRQLPTDGAVLSLPPRKGQDRSILGKANGLEGNQRENQYYANHDA